MLQAKTKRPANACRLFHSTRLAFSLKAWQYVRDSVFSAIDLHTVRQTREPKKYDYQGNPLPGQINEAVSPYSIVGWPERDTGHGAKCQPDRWRG